MNEHEKAVMHAFSEPSTEFSTPSPMLHTSLAQQEHSKARRRSTAVMRVHPRGSQPTQYADIRAVRLRGHGTPSGIAGSRGGGRSAAWRQGTNCERKRRKGERRRTPPRLLLPPAGSPWMRQHGSTAAESCRLGRRAQRRAGRLSLPQHRTYDERRQSAPSRQRSALSIARRAVDACGRGLRAPAASGD